MTSKLKFVVVVVAIVVAIVIPIMILEKVCDLKEELSVVFTSMIKFTEWKQRFVT